MDHGYLVYEISQENYFQACVELRQMNCLYNKRLRRRATG